ncbi:MAG: ABC transporter permease, partial [Chloroflexi bacterium]|nr:ABC transporter permease [Chloroflexota bacterium]
VVVRGLGTSITKSESIRFPDEITRLGSTRILDVVPVPIVIFASVVLIGHVVLTRTSFGRQVYAVGNDREAAKKAGINVGLLMAVVYIVCGFLASLGGVVNVVQLGSVHPSFGDAVELQVIGACVLGGVSLFGGRGSVFPGAVIGALFVPMINAGLQAIDVEIYLRAPAFAVVIFFAVLVDSLRNRQLARLSRRYIRMEHPPMEPATAT